MTHAELHPCVIVHYHEISLKRGNRPLFLRRLQENIARAVSDLGPVTVVQRPGRIVVDLEGHEHAEAARERLDRVCGIANLALAVRTGSSTESLKRAGDHVQAAGTTMAMRWMLKVRPQARVDLEHAELNVHVEVLPHEAFVYADRRPGAGGLPVGSGGTVMALLSGGIDSPVAAWRMIKRGCRVHFVHFHSVPYLPDTSIGKARELARRLTQWQYVSHLYLVPFGEIQREVVLAVRPMARVVAYRRLMVRIAEALARQTGALALVTGESLGQVASQTLHNLARIDEAATMPVLRPLIGMDKIEITEAAQRLDTFETSIEPDADCCTLFTPAHPATRLGREEIEAMEGRLDTGALVRAGVEGASLETFDFPRGAGAHAPSSARRARLAPPRP